MSHTNPELILPLVNTGMDLSCICDFDDPDEMLLVIRIGAAWKVSEITIPTSRSEIRALGKTLEAYRLDSPRLTLWKEDFQFHFKMKSFRNIGTKEIFADTVDPRTVMVAFEQFVFPYSREHPYVQFHIPVSIQKLNSWGAQLSTWGDETGDMALRP